MTPRQMISNLQPKSREAAPRGAQHATIIRRKGKEQQKEIHRGVFISIVNEVSKKAEGGGFRENKNRTKYIPIKWWRMNK